MSNPSPAVEEEEVPLEVPDHAIPVRIPQGAFDPAHQGEWYSLPTDTLTGPVLIHWINEDTHAHRVLAMPAAAQEAEPAWVTALDAQDHAHGDGGHGDDSHEGGVRGGDEHDHGGDGDAAGGHAHGTHEHDREEAVFDITVGPGEELLMPLEAVGILDVHCHPHPWMVDTWNILSDTPSDHPVQVHKIAYIGWKSGQADEGETATFEWNAVAPNLARFNVSLAWDDTAGQAHEYIPNAKDTLRLTILDPSGSVALEQELSASGGRLEAKHELALDWPAIITAHGAHDAARQLLERPPDERGIGTWLFQVTVIAAPGAEPETDLPLPSTDGGQNWLLTVQAEHEWVTLGEGLGEVRERRGTLI